MNGRLIDLMMKFIGVLVLLEIIGLGMLLAWSRKVAGGLFADLVFWSLIVGILGYLWMLRRDE